MNKQYRIKALFAVVAVVLSASTFATIALANHSWGNYHWARTANPFNLKLGDNVSAAWDANLAMASVDWSVSSVLDTTIVNGLSNQRNCRATNGRVEVCNNKYGKNGWLGIASIWASGDHITQGTVRLNDTYFNTAKYNTPEWKQLVVCQEVGHTLGLDHQDEIFTNANLGTCMDYTNDPSTNQHPNAHDYEQLEIIYTHLDTVTTLLSKMSGTAQVRIPDIDTENPSEWGKVIRRSNDGRSSLYERNLGNGQKIFTFVIWAD
ncbi:MAG: hypothetical protein A2747_01605 [Candidatus Yonathbacteria bacterium RIFCSPHIGHO2_01_FULL_44_41]|uniref:Peptidase M10 metallopeptidase domain-containing protein n=1 Tax=Candidatus Yonathbacteria bacterium RIFCSPHIGHO2_02_FULL_44_14 TaxID=1802724 RepID=A0A1G2SB30_9BACT|nr:MAG: hypothetical protein A2747_01605 [Candidatus Yonathbacteria bacterium RIFCSPHIGHO2_01_FULL_44_41]OHA81902.1 MAG: hypothetical protein A3D51_03965 [Candidatus Yonathbacteria bacterium RIFCSPHIGHO2_02_FULL_44_14]OHA82432.1 MAG: hypothetical protein A3B06_00825 [Candidatus Yonathbacteria bacterium RIFCSPLOWO2_01_FULL_43_20]